MKSGISALNTSKKIPDIFLTILKIHQFSWHFPDFLAKFLKFLTIPEIPCKTNPGIIFGICNIQFAPDDFLSVLRLKTWVEVYIPCQIECYLQKINYLVLQFGWNHSPMCCWHSRVKERFDISLLFTNSGLTNVNDIGSEMLELRYSVFTQKSMPSLFQICHICRLTGGMRLMFLIIERLIICRYTGKQIVEPFGNSFAVN